MEDLTRLLSTFGGRLQYARRLKSLRGAKVRQLDVAEAMGVAQSAVSNWENDFKSPESVEVLQRLARWLGVSGGWLVFGEGYPDPEDNARAWTLYGDATRRRPPGRAGD